MRWSKRDQNVCWVYLAPQNIPSAGTQTLGSNVEWAVLHCRPVVIVLSDKSNVNTVTTKAALRRAA